MHLARSAASSLTTAILWTALTHCSYRGGAVGCSLSCAGSWGPSALHLDLSLGLGLGLGAAGASAGGTGGSSVMSVSIDRPHSFNRRLRPTNSPLPLGAPVSLRASIAARYRSSVESLSTRKYHRMTRSAQRLLTARTSNSARKASFGTSLATCMTRRSRSCCIESIVARSAAVRNTPHSSEPYSSPGSTNDVNSRDCTAGLMPSRPPTRRLMSAAICLRADSIACRTAAFTLPSWPMAVPKYVNVSTSGTACPLSRMGRCSARRTPFSAAALRPAAITAHFLMLNLALCCAAHSVAASALRCRPASESAISTTSSAKPNAENRTPATCALTPVASTAQQRVHCDVVEGRRQRSALRQPIDDRDSGADGTVHAGGAVVASMSDTIAMVCASNWRSFMANSKAARVVRSYALLISKKQRYTAHPSSRACCITSCNSAFGCSALRPDLNPYCA